MSHTESPVWATLDDTLAALNLSHTRAIWVEIWPDAHQRYPGGERLNRLEPAFVQAQCQTLNLHPDLKQALNEGLALFQRQPALKRLFWACYVALFQFKLSALAFSWPMLKQDLDPAAPLFYAYVYLAGVPDLIDYHQRLDIPDSVTQDTLSDLRLWLEDYQHRHGHPGLDEFGWLSIAFTGQLYRLGRLQFELTRFRLPYRFFRHQHSHQVVALAEAGLCFRRDGRIDGANGHNDPAAWETGFQTDDETIRGHPLDPHGLARPERITLDAGAWQPILERGQAVLAVHIPAGEPMDFETCGESFIYAMNFFRRFFPAHGFRAFTCSSWLLDSQLADYLPPQSNLVRFLGEWYLLPSATAEYAGEAEILRRVMGAAAEQPAEAWPQETRLQRAIVQHHQNGGRWYSSAGVIFPSDLDWGNQPYQHHHRSELPDVHP